MTEELKACPFCGGSPSHKAWSNPSGEYGPGCTECGVTADTCAVWNTRAQLPSQGGEAVEVVGYQWLDTPHYRKKLPAFAKNQPKQDEFRPLMTVAQHQRILAAATRPADQVAEGEVKRLREALEELMYARTDKAETMARAALSTADGEVTE